MEKCRYEQGTDEKGVEQDAESHDEGKLEEEEDRDNC